VASLELQYFFDNQLVSNCLLVFVLFINIDSINYYIFIKYIWIYDLIINIIYDDDLIIYYTCKLKFIGRITIYYNHDQVWCIFESNRGLRCLRNIPFIWSYDFYHNFR